MQHHRQAIRYGAAAFAVAMAAIYYLIGLEVLKVVDVTSDAPDLFWFGIPAGSAFLLGAILLVLTDRRILWVLGALLQVLVVVGYFMVAPDRTPHFEVWGITLRILQVPLFLALVALIIGPSEERRVHATLR